MNVNENLIKLLNVPQEEISGVLLSTVGHSKEQSNSIINNWMLEKILLNYDEVKDNINVISFLSTNGVLSRFSDANTRVMVFRELSAIDFYSIKGAEIMVLLQNKSAYLRELFCIFASQLDISPSVRRVACLNLLENEKYHGIVFSTVESIVLSNTNIIDKYYFLTMLVFMYRYKNISISFRNNLYQLDDDCNSIKHYEQCIFVKGVKRDVEITDYDKLNELGQYAINGNSYYYTKEFGCIYSYHNGNKYHVKCVENIEGVYTFKTIEYKDNDYYCMIGMLCNTPRDIEQFFSNSISHRIVIKTGIFLIKNDIISAISTVFYFISRNIFDIKIRIMIAKSLGMLENKQYVNSAYDILKTYTSIMNEQDLALFHSILE